MVGALRSPAPNAETAARLVDGAVVAVVGLLTGWVRRDRSPGTRHECLPASPNDAAICIVVAIETDEVDTASNVFG